LLKKGQDETLETPAQQKLPKWCLKEIFDNEAACNEHLLLRNRSKRGHASITSSKTHTATRMACLSKKKS